MHPHRHPSHRRAIVTVVALVLSMLALVGVGTAPPAAAATTTTDGPNTIVTEPGDIGFAITFGQDAQCGPGIGGDGWQCSVAHTPHRIELSAGGVREMTGVDYRDKRVIVELYRSDYPSQLPSLGSPLARKVVTCGDCSRSPVLSYPLEWASTTTTAGGAYWARMWREWIWYDFDGYPHDRVTDSGFVGLVGGRDCRSADPSATCPGRVLPRVLTASEVLNRPPTVRVVSPSSGQTIWRTTPEHFQTFSIEVADADGHNIDAWIDVTGPSGWSHHYDFQRVVNAGSKATTTLTTPPVQMPHANGTYRIAGTASDTSGTATARAEDVISFFDYDWNSPPLEPTSLVPSSTANRLPANSPLVFVARATDPEHDPLRIRTTINGREYESLPTASDREAITVIPDPLPAGSYPFTLRGVDSNSATGPTTTSQVEAISLDDNRPPNAPELVSPTAGGGFASGAPQEFTIRAIDPNNDMVRGLVEVRDAATAALVSAFPTDAAPSGGLSTGRPAIALPAGGYMWSARAFDDNGALGPPSGSQAFSVDPAVAPSDDCLGGTTAADMTAGGHYGRLQAKGNDVCWRVDGPAAGSGGKVTVTIPNTATPPTPTLDTNTAACTTVLVAGEVGDASDPTTYVPFRLATGIESGAASVCLDLGDRHQRLRQQVPGAPGTPTIVPSFDPPGSKTHPVTAPLGLPSSACTGKAGATTYVNGAAGPAFVHVTSWQESPTRTHLCFREQWASGAGAPSTGGRITVDTTASPGVTPVLSTGTDFTGCPRQVARLTSPVSLGLWRSDPGNPATVCVDALGTPLRVTAGTSGTAIPPAITWTPDPGTPGV